MGPPGYLAEALVAAHELSDADRLLLSLLRDVCDYHAGRITRSEYVQRQKDLSEKNEGEFGLSRKINYLWEDLVDDGTREGAAAKLGELRTVVDQVLALEDGSESLRIQARTALLYAEGVQFIHRFTHDQVMLKAGVAMGRAVDADRVYGELNADLASWTGDANALVSDARQLGNLHLLGDACYSRSFILFVQQSSAQLWLKPETVSRHFGQMRAEVVPDVRRAIECYQRSGHVEWELRAKMLLADMAALTGDNALAAEMANEVLPVAEAFQFDRVVKEARDHLAGDPFFRQTQRKLVAAMNEDPDIRDAKVGDADVEREARMVLKAAGLPADRLAVITREVQSLRDIARERVNWCRYIQLIQSLAHTQSPSSYYARDPERYCLCEKFGFRSSIGNADWSVIVRTFKDNYCAGCSARSPKSAPE